MKVTIVYDNEVKQDGLRAGWGFSALIENEKIEEASLKLQDIITDLETKEERWLELSEKMEN